MMCARFYSPAKIIALDTDESRLETAYRQGLIVAMYEENQSIPLPFMYGKNLTFKTGGADGSDCGKIMELIEKGRLDTSCLITHRTTFDKILEAYDVFESKKDGIIKYAVKVS